MKFPTLIHVRSVVANLSASALGFIDGAIGARDPSAEGPFDANDPQALLTQAISVVQEQTKEINRLRGMVAKLQEDNRTLYQENIRILNQARPDSIKNTVPIAILRAVQRRAEQDPLKISFFGAEGPISSGAILNLCREDAPIAHEYVRAVIDHAVEFVAQRGPVASDAAEGD